MHFALVRHAQHTCLGRTAGNDTHKASHVIGRGYPREPECNVYTCAGSAVWDLSRNNTHLNKAHLLRRCLRSSHAAASMGMSRYLAPPVCSTHHKPQPVDTDIQQKAIRQLTMQLLAWKFWLAHKAQLCAYQTTQHQCS